MLGHGAILLLVASRGRPWIRDAPRVGRGRRDSSVSPLRLHPASADRQGDRR
ncbi:hypothetical protein BEI_2216 [Halomonas beimenensis]|uniref:Uncharacterized protein n=1 Tax=Halomonas beimenensis TaxID=475662 RepID=A0A291P8F5_9GAMM|nr:hypothetical protein BEI_2216 [Halomonas beimenensis]